MKDDQTGVLLAYYVEENPNELHFDIGNDPRLGSVDEAEKYLIHDLDDEFRFSESTWVIIKVCKRFKLRTQTTLVPVGDSDAELPRR